MLRPPPTSTLFPYTTLFRSCRFRVAHDHYPSTRAVIGGQRRISRFDLKSNQSKNECAKRGCASKRSEEHTSELQSHVNLVCRLLLEKKKKQNIKNHSDTTQ